MPGFPVYHQLSELAQTHVHQVSDAIQPSHPLSLPSPPTFNLSNELVLHIRWSESTGASVQFSSVQSLSCVQLFATPRTATLQASLSITILQSPHKPMSIKSVMPSNHLILCHCLLLLPSIFPSIRVFSNEPALCIRWPNIGVSAQHQSFQWTPRTDLL